MIKTKNLVEIFLAITIPIFQIASLFLNKVLDKNLCWETVFLSFLGWVGAITIETFLWILSSESLFFFILHTLLSYISLYITHQFTSEEIERK